MLHLDAHASMHGLRIGKDLADIVDRAAGHADRLQRGDPVGAVAGHGQPLDLRLQLQPVAHPVGVAGKARVAGKLRFACHLAEAGELRIVADGKDEGPVACRIGVVGHDGGMGIAPARRHIAVGEAGDALVDQPGDLGVEQGDVEMLALAGGAAVMQRGEDGVGGIHAAHHVGDADAGLGRLAAFRIRPAGERHQPAHPLDEKVVAGPVRIGAVLAEAGDRAIDEAGIFRRQRLVAEPAASKVADLEILHQHIGAARQPAHQGNALLARQVDGERTLVAVGGEVIGAFAGLVAVRIAQEGRSPAAGVVAAAGPLDLDHVGPEIAEELGGGGTGEDARQVEHLHPGERSPAARTRCGRSGSGIGGRHFTS